MRAFSNMLLRRACRLRRGTVLTLSLLMPTAAAAQTDLDRAVERARTVWLVHDVSQLLETSDTVRLHLPGVATSASVRPGQAARLLEQYLKNSQEREFSLQGVRQLAADHAYAEFSRAYAVEGTAEQRRETVFLGFRRLEGAWRLREVRVTP